MEIEVGKVGEWGFLGGDDVVVFDGDWGVVLLDVLIGICCCFDFFLVGCCFDWLVVDDLVVFVDWWSIGYYLVIVVVFVLVFDYVVLGVFCFEVLLYIGEGLGWYVGVVNDIVVFV